MYTGRVPTLYMLTYRASGPVTLASGALEIGLLLLLLSFSNTECRVVRVHRKPGF